MYEGVSMLDYLTNEELMKLQISPTEIYYIQRFCRILGMSFAATGVETYEDLYNRDDLIEMNGKLNIPYDIIIKCIYDNQNFYYNYFRPWR